MSSGSGEIDQLCTIVACQFSRMFIDSFRNGRGDCKVGKLRQSDIAFATGGRQLNLALDDLWLRRC